MADSKRPIEPAELLAEAGWLRAFSRKLVPDPELALDLEQETMRAALEKPPAAGAGVRSWMRAVARNLSRRHRRDEAVRRYHEERAARPDLDGGEATLERLQLQRRIVDAVSALDEPYRTAVTLRHLDGRSYHETARRMGVSEEAARKRVSRGLERLRDELDDAYGGRSSWGLLAFAVAQDLPLPAPVPLVPIAPVAPVAPGAPIPSGAEAASQGALLLAQGASMSAAIKWSAAVAATVLVGTTWWWKAGVGDDPATPNPLAAVPDESDLVRPEETIPVAHVPAGRGREAADTLGVPAVAAETDDASAARIAGRVLDGEGKPLPGATVRLARRAGLDYQILDSRYRDQETEQAQKITGVDGSFTFDVDPGRRYLIEATAPELCSDLVSTAFAGGSYDLVLTPGASLFGFVSRPDGLPAIDAEIRLRPSNGGGLGIQTVRTDRAGQYRFSGLAAGAYALKAHSNEGATPAGTAVEVASGEEYRTDFALGEGYPLKGRITDAVTGEPIAGAEVSESWVFEKIVRTNTNGEYFYTDYPRESYSGLSVRAAGYGSKKATVRGYAQSSPTKDTWNFELEPSALVSGRVVDEEGQPLADVYICCSASVRVNGAQQTDWSSDRTDAEGRYAVQGVRPDIPHALFVQKDGFGTCVWEIGYTEQDTEIEDVVLRPGASLRGRVMTQDGAPFVDGLVTLYGCNTDRSERFGYEVQEHLDSYAAERDVRTDESGEFRFLDLADGDYAIVPSAHGMPELARIEVQVRGRDVDAGKIEVAIGLTVDGCVTDADGQPVALVFVRARNEDPSNPMEATAITTTDGSFLISGMEPGMYALELYPVSQGGPEPLARTEVSGIAAGAKDIELTLPRAAVLRGHVVSADGTPVENATVRMVDPTGLTSWELTDPDGAFELTPPMGVEVELFVHPPLAERDPEKAFQFDDDPAKQAHLKSVKAEHGSELKIVLPETE